ncbi:MAG: DUF3617 family protein [Rhizobiales bacterium]|nr:DUF3617 family protein [Hyphomicrobiales bacterium]
MKNQLPAMLAGLAAALMLAAFAPAHAADGPQPGMWKMAVKVTYEGRQAIVAREQSTCITPELAKRQQEGEAGPASSPGQNCKRVNFQRTANGMTMRFQCAGELAMDTTMTYTYDSPRHYTVVMNSTGKRGGATIKSITTIDARRVGECPK